MAYRFSISVEDLTKQGKEYRLRYMSTGYNWTEKTIDYETAMIILGAIDQGREQIKHAIRQLIGAS